MSWEVRTMRSGTSFFNGTLYRKAFFRFWPIWALYGTMWLLILPLRFLAEAMRGSVRSDQSTLEYLQQIARDIPSALPFGVTAAAVAGVVCAMAVFSYLYSSRSACMMHALPARREALFVSHYLAGLSFLLLPHLAVYALTLAVEASLSCLALGPLTTWLLAQSGMCLFFYSFAVFCAMFTGNLVALPVFYGILNFLATILVQLLETVCRQFLYGFYNFPSALYAAAEWLTPALNLYRAVVPTYTTDAVLVYSPETVGIYAAAGVVLAAAALLVYRARHIESAGDVVAVKLVRPVFKYGFAFCTGLTGGMATAAILLQESGAGLTFWVVVWGIIGYFAAEMLLKKSFRVLKAWKGSVALGAVMLLLCLSVSLDWYGFESRVPAADQVESVTVYGLEGVPNDGATYGPFSNNLELSDPDDIELVTQLHQAAVQSEGLQDDGRQPQPEQGWGDGYVYLQLTYHLSDGRTMERRYTGLPIYEKDLETQGTFTWAANQLTTDRDHAASLYSFDQLDQGRLVEAFLERVWNTQRQEYETIYIDGSVQALYDAVKQDFAEGTIGVRYLLEDSQERQDNTCITDLYFTVEIPEDSSDQGPSSSATAYDWSITLTPHASHTLALLRELGALDDTHVAPTYGTYLNDTESLYDTYRNPDGSLPEDILYDARYADGPTAVLTSP